MSYKPIANEIFHVHTKRCKHAANETDEEYIEAAIKEGAKRIVFTDHVPFPENPFKGRMDYEELFEYVSTINRLKEKYIDKIEILCGFEVEYLPSYLEYFKRLKVMEGVDLLIIGQHFYEHEDGTSSFCDKDKTYEYEGQCKAMAAGIRTGLFDVVAHPDRSFRISEEIFNERERAAAQMVIDALLEDIDHAPYLEKNYSSKMRGRFFKQCFWDMVPDCIKITYGLDAHCVDELVDGYRYKW